MNNSTLWAAEHVKNTVKSLISIYVSDVDFSSVYPNVMRGCNIARDTFRSTIFGLGDFKGRKNVVDICSRSINTRENTVGVCSDYMGLPDYDEFKKILDKKYGGDGCEE